MHAAEIVDGPIVVELVVVPASALIAGAAIAVAVVNSAVIPNVRSPIPTLKTKTPPAKAQYPGVHNRPGRGGSPHVPGTQ
jgi:hypothetical protein